MLNEKVKAIKAYMKQNKITYDELSAKSGIPISTINYIFTGRTENPRTDTMLSIEKALGLDGSALRPNETAEVVPAETRPALKKVIDQCSNLNDLGLAVVFGMVIALMRDHPEYRLA